MTVRRLGDAESSRIRRSGRDRQPVDYNGEKAKNNDVFFVFTSYRSLTPQLTGVRGC